MRRPTTAARRYAEAAFELALRDDALDAWLGGLDLAVLLVGDAEVQRRVDDPSMPMLDRRVIVDRLLDGRVPTGVANLVRVLLQRGRIDRLSHVAAAYRRLLNQHRGIVEATITSAVPLGPAETEAIGARVEAMTGHAVDLTTLVDAGLIGGLTVRVGDSLLDASLRGRLERLRDQLVTSSR